MSLILAVLVAASQTMYEAKVTTFGCFSIEDVSKLQSIRSNQKAFQSALIDKVMYGYCHPIQKGEVLEGWIETTDTSMLLVFSQSVPPGYVAPLNDFELKAGGDR
jgi:hypothetical protein